MPTLTKLYCMEEVAIHNTPDDCWVVVDGKIYDVTKYLDDHPGGADVLLAATAYCLILNGNLFEGKDATEEFEDAGHSKDARALMQDYFIGELDVDEEPEIPEMEILRKEQDMDFASNVVAYAMQYWAVPVATIGVSAVVAILYARRK